MYNDNLIEQFAKEKEITFQGNFYAISKMYIKWLEDRLQKEDSISHDVVLDDVITQIVNASLNKGSSVVEIHYSVLKKILGNYFD